MSSFGKFSANMTILSANMASGEFQYSGVSVGRVDTHINPNINYIRYAGQWPLMIFFLN